MAYFCGHGVEGHSIEGIQSINATGLYVDLIIWINPFPRSVLWFGSLLISHSLSQQTP